MNQNIIFDMDGTLLDTAIATCEACESCRKDFNLPHLEKEAITRAIGIPNPKFYEILYPDFPKKLVEAFGTKVEKLESEIIQKLGKKLLFSGISNLLQYLETQGVLMYLASTGSKNHVITAISSSGINRYFEEICFGEPDKTDIIKNLKHSRPFDKWIMVGDRKSDAKAAHKNDVFSIGAGFGYCGDLDKSHFDAFAENPMDIPEILGI
ncbi:MAG: HAD family hydrolase [Christensenellales bacterium]|jgi:phosphoglycolate phosphatase